MHASRFPKFLILSGTVHGIAFLSLFFCVKSEPGKVQMDLDVKHSIHEFTASDLKTGGARTPRLTVTRKFSSKASLLKSGIGAGVASSLKSTAQANLGEVLGTSAFHLTGESLNQLQSENPKPSYPDSARELGQQGRVILRVTLRIQGERLLARAGQVAIEKSSGVDSLDEQAKTTVASQWDFSSLEEDAKFQSFLSQRPGLAEVKLRLPFRFLLSDL